MSIRKLFKPRIVAEKNIISPNYGGIIKQLALEDFWTSLTEDEKKIVRIGTKRSFGLSDFNLTDVDSLESNLITRRNSSSFLIGIAVWTLEMEKYSLADKLLLKAIELAPDKFTIHSAYKWLINLHNELRYKFKSSQDVCIKFCQEDIELLPVLYEESGQSNKMTLNFKSFKILSTIYKEIGLEEESKELEELELFYHKFLI